MSEEKKEEKKEEGLVEKDKETAVELRKTEEAIAHGMGAIAHFGKIMTNDEERQNATVGAGSVVGAVANLAADAKAEPDEEKREKLMEIGTTSVMEIAHGFMSVMLAGARKRREKKQAEQIQGKVKLIEEKK